MVEECKQDPGATTQQDYKIEEDEEEEAIRPSIPSIIPLKSHDDARANSSSGDDCSEALSVSSLISEVTLMTFSEEKAAMLRSEFISRVEQDSHTRPLSRDEKLALLSEIQADQDKKFKVEMRRQETKRNMKREGEKTRHEFFERLNALRVNNGIDMKTVVQQQQQQQQMERDQIDTSEHTSTSESGGGGGQEEVNSGDSGTQDEEKKKERQGPCRRASMMRRYRRASGLSSSDITEKRCNSNRTLLRGSCGTKDEPDSIAIASLRSSVNSDSEATTQTNTTKRAAIEELIALKMEIANQQATIDTITARLHNFEINNSKLSSSLSEERSARKAAEKSNEELTEQLRRCRESEIELRREVMSLSATRPPMVKQISTVDWGDADESDLVDRIKKLEQENEELSKENARLQRQQEMRESGRSVKTDCTEPPTSLDSSSEHKSSPQHQSRPNLGASLRSFSSSIKLPLTKMVRSSSEVSVPSRANFEGEETLTERTISTGKLDATADNNSGAGTVQGHVKFSRRWSTGDGRKQKIADESAGGGRARRWGSYSLDDIEDDEEGKGNGGWFNGFSLFGKVDEEVGDEAI